MDLIRRGLTIAQDPKHTTWIGLLLVLADAALSALIVHKIPCELTNPTPEIVHG
jgi:alpha-1,3-mannosyltransferase